MYEFTSSKSGKWKKNTLGVAVKREKRSEEEDLVFHKLHSSLFSDTADF